MSTYSEHFHKYIAKSVRYLLSEVQATDTLLAEDLCKQALHTLSYALDLNAVWPDAQALLFCMAPKMEQAGYRDDWLPYLEQGIEQSRAMKHLAAEAELHLHLGLLHRMRSRFRAARDCFRTSAAQFKSLDQPGDQARALSYLAHVATLERQYEEASQLVNRAHELLNSKDVRRAFGYFVQGAIALDKRHWEDAINCFEQARTLWQQANEQRWLVRSLRNLGPALQALGRYEEAITCYEQALDFFEQIPDPAQKALTQMDLGIAYSLRGDPDKALAQYALAEPTFRKVEDELNLAKVYTNQVIDLRRLQQWDRAKQASQRGINLWRKLRNLRSLVNAMDGLGLVYLEQGLNEKAATIFQCALDQLAYIQDDPGHDRLKMMLTDHLNQASGRQS